MQERREESTHLNTFLVEGGDQVTVNGIWDSFDMLFGIITSIVGFSSILLEINPHFLNFNMILINLIVIFLSPDFRIIVLIIIERCLERKVC